MIDAEIADGTAPVGSGEAATAVGAVPSPHAKAIAEAGRLMLLDAVVVGREFCKFMIGVVSGAVPIYLGLLEWVRPTSKGLGRTDQLIAAVPVLLFLASSTVFMLAYLPMRGTFSLDVIEDVEMQRAEAINKRHYGAVVGFTFFLAGVCGATFVVIRLTGRSIDDSMLS